MTGFVGCTAYPEIMSNWDGRLAVFDLETTGVDVDTSHIVSACVAVLEGDGSVVARWDWLADPGIEIPEGASAVHGITTERARAEGRPAAIVVAEIAQTLSVLFGQGIPVVVYNAPYDLSLLDRECRRHHLTPIESPAPVIDPLVLDKAVDRYRKGKRTLEVTAALYQVSLDDAHDAGSDAIAAGRVAQALARTFPDELDLPFAELHGRQEVWYAEQAASFEKYIREVKGDQGYRADASWPLRPLGDRTSYVDTQPIPVPPPRPSGNVPVLDFTRPMPLQLAAPPALFERVELELEVEVTVESEQVDSQPIDSEPAWLVEPSAPSYVSLDPQLGPEAAAEPSPEPEPEPGFTVDAADAPDPDDHFDDTAWLLPEPTAPSRPVLHIAAALVTDPAGRTLLVRKHGTSAFMQPGGKIERGESATVALIRELEEELGLTVDPVELEYLGAYTAAAANEHVTEVEALVFAVEVEGELAARGEIAELLWLSTPADADGREIAPLTRDELLPLWATRRPTLF